MSDQAESSPIHNENESTTVNTKNNAQDVDAFSPPPSHEGSNTSNSSQQQPKKRKEMTPRSIVWSHFTKYTTENGEKKARCNYCQLSYAANPTINGTTALKNHMKGCMKNPHNNEAYTTQVKQQPYSSAHGGKAGSIVTWRFNQDDTRKACAYMIIVDEQPFSFVEKQGFRHFMSVACPSFQIPSRTTITRDCYNIYLEEKTKLKNFLRRSSKRICLTTDSWTSEQQINYMCLTAHFIDDDWVLHKRILNFCPIESHKGEAIGKGVEKCLLDWGIENVFSITVDNASSNDVAVSYLKKRFSNWGTSLLGGKYIHVRCIAHIINLVVADGLKEILFSINRVRAAIRYIRQSPSRLKKFKESVEMEKIESKRLLCLDVPTRWNSTYLMLDTALTLAKAFERLEDLDPHFKFDLQFDHGGLPSEEDWDKISRFVKFLGHFYELTLRISGSLYVTSNQVLHELSDVVKLLNTWEDGDDAESSQMAKRMRDKYNKYWGNCEKMNFIIFYAVILDPRFKFHYVGWVIRKMYPDKVDLVDKVKEGIYALFEEYKRLNSSPAGHTSPLGPLPSSSSASYSSISSQYSQDSYKPPVRRRHLEVDTRREYDLFLNEGGGVDTKNELDKFLGEEREKDDDGFDILKWWKLNAPRFPIIAQMARDILAVPVSTVASESAFSMGGRVLDTFRSSLTPRIVQCLMCAKDWLRDEAKPVNIEEDIDILETMDHEFAKYGHESTILDL